MNNYLFLHWEAACSAWKTLVRQPVGTVLVLLMLAVAMTLPLALYVGVKSSSTLWGRLNETPQITLYLDRAADEAAAAALYEKVGRDPQVAAAEFVGKQEGMRQLQQAFQGQDLVSMLDENPLPDVVVVDPKDGLTPEEHSALHSRLAALPQVESAEMDAAWMQTLYGINLLVRQIFYFLSFTLSVAFVLVAHNTIRLQILGRKEEIEITKLLGAPASFIRRPFVYLAVWQGLLAAVLSLFLCSRLIALSRPAVDAVFAPYGIHLEWHALHWGEMAFVVAFVCALAAAGAWRASSSHLSTFRASRR